MTIDQWWKLHKKEMIRFGNREEGLPTLNPDTWQEYKNSLVEYINSIDEITKIFHEENSNKNKPL